MTGFYPKRRHRSFGGSTGFGAVIGWHVLNSHTISLLIDELLSRLLLIHVVTRSVGFVKALASSEILYIPLTRRPSESIVGKARRSIMTQPPLEHQALPEMDIARWIDIDELCAGDTDITSTFKNDFDRDVTTWRRKSAVLPGSSTTTGYNEEEHPPSQPEEDYPNTSSLETREISRFSVICFPSDPARPEGKKKKRRDFAEHRRQEVAQIRKAGACLRCKIRRTSVRLSKTFPHVFKDFRVGD